MIRSCSHRLQSQSRYSNSNLGLPVTDKLIAMHTLAPLDFARNINSLQVFRFVSMSLVDVIWQTAISALPSSPSSWDFLLFDADDIAKQFFSNDESLSSQVLCVICHILYYIVPLTCWFMVGSQARSSTGTHLYLFVCGVVRRVLIVCATNNDWGQCHQSTKDGKVS